MTKETKIDVIRTGIKAITSFPFSIEDNGKIVTIRINVGFTKDILVQYTTERFEKVSCRAIVVDTITELRRIVDDYTCSNSNYLQVVTQLTSPEFKKLEKA